MSENKMITEPFERYERALGGPYTITRTDASITVESAAGRTAVVAANASNFANEIEQQLTDGIAVTIDGAVVGQLFQHRHGFWRADRCLEFVPVDADRFPPAPSFRLRRSTKVVCENADGQLIGPPWFVPFGGQQLTVADGVSDDLMLIYAAVASGLIAVLKL